MLDTIEWCACKQWLLPDRCVALTWLPPGGQLQARHESGPGWGRGGEVEVEEGVHITLAACMERQLAVRLEVRSFQGWR